MVNSYELKQWEPEDNEMTSLNSWKKHVAKTELHTHTFR